MNYLDIMDRMKEAYHNLKHAFPEHGLVKLANLASSGGFVFSDEFWKKYPEELFPKQFFAFREYAHELELEMNRS